MMRSQPTIPIQPRKPIPAGPPFPILEAKLAPALGRPGIVPRANLLDWLEASAGTPVVAICAPAGYGKTVLAAEWAERDRRPFVWLSIDRHDNDPAVLLTYLAMGLDRVEPIDPAVFAALASRGASITHTVLPRSRPPCPARRSQLSLSWTMCMCSMTRKAETRLRCWSTISPRDRSWS